MQGKSSQFVRGRRKLSKVVSSSYQEIPLTHPLANRRKETIGFKTRVENKLERLFAQLKKCVP